MIDFSAGTDTFPSLYTAITSWFMSQRNPQVILDGRVAADMLRGTPCVGDTRGGINTNLLANYFVRGWVQLRLDLKQCNRRKPLIVCVG